MPLKTQEEQRAYQRQHYQDNKERYAESQRRKRQRAKEFIAAYKLGKKCTRCPPEHAEGHPACLEFHHTGNNGEKEIQVSQAMYYWGVERIKREIAKCELICANCHRKLHYEEMKDRGVKLLYEKNQAIAQSG